TNPDRSALFEKQSDSLFFRNSNQGGGNTIVIDEAQQFQDIDGFGFALTGGSAGLLMKMSPDKRNTLLQELFSENGNSAGISYIRLSIGASDLNDFVFSYDDLPEGETDFELKKFSLAQDLNDVVPVMKEILAINPAIKILGSPWSAPKWMKTNNNIRNGSLKVECYDVYALYFVKYIQAMKKEGIAIDAITVQNEPLNSRNTPSMPWFVSEQASFIRDHLGPTFRKAGLTTKIILFDHNCDRPDYPLALLSDPELARYVDGSGFHHYGGDLSAMSLVHQARPDKNLYFTEQMVTERPGSSTINITAPVKRLIIGATRNWSRNVILWNLAADPLNDPHTDNGGCSMCQGAVTIDGDKVIRNIAFYTVAHASKFVRPGSARIASTNTGDNTISLTEDEERPGLMRATVIENTQVLPNVAFRTTGGRIVLIVANDTWSVNSFKIQHKGQYARVQLQPGAVGTYIW
ncbi:MAG: glycoside hydrolase family 30 beta sandwich domain-containing protein, partial [Bacteroidales bacterium]